MIQVVATSDAKESSDRRMATFPIRFLVDKAEEG